MEKSTLRLLVAIVIIVLLGLFVVAAYKADRVVAPKSEVSVSPEATGTPTSSPAATPTPSASATPTPGFVEPIAEFKERATKKLFGTHVTPKDSPVQPEKFTGYHTGTDVEYGDVSGDIPVYAVADGTIELSKYISGYGGVVVLKTELQGRPVHVLYGHLRLSSAVALGTAVKAGDRLGVLGTAYSEETDGERRHLHLSIYTGSQVDVKGYVQSEAALSDWEDPLKVLAD